MDWRHFLHFLDCLIASVHGEYIHQDPSSKYSAIPVCSDKLMGVWVHFVPLILLELQESWPKVGRAA